MIRQNGILLVDKPAGVTSFAVVNHVRRALVTAYPQLTARGRGIKRQPGQPKPPKFKCGHAGTLDPLATGLLVVLVGKGSRLSPFLMGLDKSYGATIRFGLTTDTLDRDGQVMSQCDVPQSVEVVLACLDRFQGPINQVPPLISALKRNGQPLYKLARSGQDVPEPEARPVTIGGIQPTGQRWGESQAEDTVYELDLDVTCSSGTYIRSLARDLAQAAGTEGIIQQLRRLTVGPFSVTDAVTGVMDLSGEALAEHMLPLAAALPDVPFLSLSDVETDQVHEGGQPDPSWLERLSGDPVPSGKHGRLFRLLDPGGDLVAVCQLDDETNAPKLMAVIAKEAPACD